ncbi:isocitrate/isopropylmalate dehydrogenase family protein [bacterium]|nr:isocitrate/isopropylmalate dehydrogenase family protein [bacterium]MBU1599792.1 isocitrate/isopropylmalate dehydrogenase family protein [bacterium]
MKITLVKGDGIGPEIIEATCRILEASGARIEWDEVYWNEEIPDVEPIIDSLKRNRVGLKGPITTPVGKGFRSINVTLRQRLDLYAGVRPAKSLMSGGRYENIDLVIIRENTEGMYSGVEHYVGKDAAESIRIITRFASERIVRFAFEIAIREGRKKVTAVHKANILKCTCGLFLETARSVAQNYPDIQFEDRIIDNMCMQLVKKPEDYDVIVATNLFGDILSDLCAGLVGGLGLAAGANFGQDIALFEPVHGSAPKYKGQDRANPLACLLSAVMMLKHIGKQDIAHKIESAIQNTLKNKNAITPDLGGTGSLSSMRNAIIKEVYNRESDHLITRK